MADEVRLKVTGETVQFQAAMTKVQGALEQLAQRGGTAAQMMNALNVTGDQARDILQRLAAGGMQAGPALAALGITGAKLRATLIEMSSGGITAAAALERMGLSTSNLALSEQECAKATALLEAEIEKERQALARARKEKEENDKSTKKLTRSESELTKVLRRVGPEGVKLNKQGEFDNPTLEKYRKHRIAMHALNKAVSDQIKGQDTMAKATDKWYTRMGKSIRRYGKFVSVQRIASGGIRSFGAFASTAFERIGGSMAFMTSSLTTLIGILTGATLGMSFKWAKDFDTALRGINVLIPKTEQNMQRLRESVLGLAQQRGFDVFDLAKSFELAVSTDVKASELDQFMDTATKLAVVGQTSTENTVKLLTTLKNTFQLTMQDIEAAGDIAFATVDKSTATIEQLSTAVGSFSAEARGAGANVIEMMSLFSALTLQSGDVRRAGMEMRNFFMMFNKMSEKGHKALKQFGLETTVTAAAIRSRGLMPVLEDMVKAFQKNDQLLPLVAEDMRKFAAATKVVHGALDVAKVNMGEFTDSTGRLTEAFNQFEDGPGQKWNKLMATMKTAAIDWGDAVAKTFEAWLDQGGRVEIMQKRLLKYMKQTELAFRFMYQFIATMVGGITVLFAAIYKGFTLIDNWYASYAQQMTAWFLQPLLKVVNGVNQLVETELGTKMSKGLQGIVTDLNDAVRENQREIAKTGEEWDELMATIDDTLGFSSNWNAIKDLINEIGNLGDEIKMMEDQSVAAAQRNGNSVKDAFEKAREAAELAAAERLAQTTRVTETLADHYKEQAKLAEKTSSKKLQLLRKEQTQAKKIYEDALKEYAALEEDRLKINQNINERIFNIQQSMRTPGQQKSAIKDMALMYEEYANQAAKRADIPKALDEIGKSMDFWEQLLQFSDSRGSKKKIMATLERLRDEANQLIDKGQAEEERRAADADAKFKEVSQKIVDLEAATAAFISSVKTAVEYWSSLTVKTQDVVDQAIAFFKDAIAQQEILLTMNTDPALQKLNELKGVINETVMNGGKPPVLIVNGRRLADTPSGGGTINYGSVNITVNADGKVVDPRQLGIEIGRQVRRGQLILSNRPTQ